jgi:hypothetical protein
VFFFQAEAEYEGLKGLLEWRIQQEQAQERARIQECLSQSTSLPKVESNFSTQTLCPDLALFLQV